MHGLLQQASLRPKRLASTGPVNPGQLGQPVPSGMLTPPLGLAPIQTNTNLHKPKQTQKPRRNLCFTRRSPVQFGATQATESCGRQRKPKLTQTDKGTVNKLAIIMLTKGALAGQDPGRPR